MRVNLGIWDKLNRLVVFLLFLAGLLGVFFWYLPLIETNKRYRKEILDLEAKLQEHEKVRRYQKAALNAIQNDPRTLERLVREKLGYARSNEVVVVFQPPAAASPPRR